MSKLFLVCVTKKLDHLKMPKGKQAAFKMTEPAAEVGTEDAPCFGEVPESSCEDVSEDVMAFLADL